MPEPVMLVVLGAAAGAVGTGAAGRLGERIVDRVWPERNATEPSRVVAVQNAEAMSIVKSTGPALVNSICPRSALPSREGSCRNIPFARISVASWIVSVGT